jgi:hypothetical protein
MALLGAGFRETLTGRMFGSTMLNGTTPNIHEHHGHMAARMRNQFAGEGITDSTASVPSGNRHPAAWVMAPKNGAMSSRNNASLSFTPTANGTMGVPIDGTASFLIDTNTPDGQLISSAIGSASFAITPTGNVLATLSGVGSSTMTFTTNTPAMSAQGWAQASGAMTLTATLTSYAKGMMVGSTVDTSSIVNANIVSVNGYSVTGNGQTGSEWGPG